MAKNETVKQKRLKAAAIVLGIAALLISCALGFFLRGAIVGKDAAALSEIAAYLKVFGVFDSSTAEIREFTAEDAARLIVKNVPDDYAAYYTKDKNCCIFLFSAETSFLRRFLKPSTKIRYRQQNLKIRLRSLCR